MKRFATWVIFAVLSIAFRATHGIADLNKVSRFCVMERAHKMLGYNCAKLELRSVPTYIKSSTEVRKKLVLVNWTLFEGNIVRWDVICWKYDALPLNLFAQSADVENLKFELESRLHRSSSNDVTDGDNTQYQIVWRRFPRSVQIEIN